MKEVKQYAIAHAVKQDTFGLRFDGGKSDQFTLKYDKENPNKAKNEFIASLDLGDQIHMIAGSGAERFALGAVRHGAEVFRVPTHRVHDELETRGNGIAIGDEDTEEIKLKKKTSERLKSLIILRDFAVSEHGVFYPFLEREQRLAEIAILADAYDMIQNRIRKPAVQRLRASVADLDIVEPIGEIDIEVYLQEHLAESLFGPVRKIVKEKKNKKGEVIKPAHKETFVEVLERSFMGVEERLQYRIQQAFRGNILWENMFRHVPGCGPVIAARVIAGVKDIKFFDCRAKLVEAAGYGFLPDGSRKRRVRLSSDTGREVKRNLSEMFPEWSQKELNEAIRMNWRPTLKQAVYLFCEQIRGFAHDDNPWKMAYQHRVAYEEARQEQFAPKPDGTKSFPPARAERWLGKQFLKHIWAAWRRCEAGGEYRPYDFECLRG